MSGLQLRGDTAANWTAANPVLAAREIALTLNGIGQTVAVRFGDGTTAWTALANFRRTARGLREYSSRMSRGFPTWPS